MVDGHLFHIVVAFVRLTAIVTFCMIGAAFMVWVERKGAAYIQGRRGPNRASIGGVTAGGLFHPLADAVKFMWKEDFIPDRAHKFFYQVAPVFTHFPAMLAIAAVPFGPPLIISGHTIALQIADLNVGILYLFGVGGLGVYGVILGGWASNSKYPLLGSLRSAAQVISYEVSKGLSVAGIMMVYGSPRLSVITERQADLLFGFLPKWGIFVQPVAFILFLVAVYAETNRTPFDLPESESEIVAGYHTEYGSFKFSMFMMGEYLHMLVGSAVIVALFFGGWQFPYLADGGFSFPGGASYAMSTWAVWSLRMAVFLLKFGFFAWLFVWVRWTIPRLRYDQVMRLGWKVQLTIALANIFVTGALILLFGDGV